MKDIQGGFSRIAVTICSRAKDERPGLLPARRRYIGTHIGKVEEVAGDMGLPFFIISGIHGMISPEERIQYYDHELQLSEVEELSRRITEELKDLEVREVCLYTKQKPIWKRYQEALWRATRVLEIELHVFPLDEDA